ncbi:MAG TPA: hypothetical protein VMM38_16140 [Aridibacter sp.]|nr:hypothetical protein [Aridibacter sp.]
MNNGFTSIPFKAESGLSEINGIGKFSSAGVVLEFESKLLGLIKGGVKEIRISLDEILDVKFRKGLFRIGASIQIRLKNFSKMSDLLNDSGKIKLKIKREDFEVAREAVERLSKDLEHHNAGLPPAQTSVSSLFGNTSELETSDLDTKELDD